jgi:hypothetical protein
MTVTEIIAQVRILTRMTDTNSNPDSAMLLLVQMAYNALVGELAANNHRILDSAYDLTLTGLRTPLPAEVQIITEVQDRTGLDALSEGNYLGFVASVEASSSAQVGWTQYGREIALVNIDWTGKTIRIFHRGVPETLTTASVPAQIPPFHHDAIVWKTAVLILARDGTVDVEFKREMQESVFRMLSGVQLPNEMGAGPR